MRLPRLLTRLRQQLRRAAPTPADTAPAAPVPEPSGAADEHAEFASLLETVGASPPDGSDASLLAMRDATIAELESTLRGLRPIGEQLASTEQERLALAERVARLESSLDEALVAVDEARQDVERLERELAERNGVLERERERHAGTRDKLADRKRAAAERWHELRSLRAENRRLQAALDQRADDQEARPPLPSEPTRDGRTSSKRAS